MLIIKFKILEFDFM